MKVAVIPNIDKRGATDVVATLGKMLKAEGIEAFLPDNICGTDYQFASEDEIYKIADIIITIGGDGTIIRFAKRAALDNKPVLGINAGRMGYLADIEQNEINLIKKLFSGDYFIEDRMMLSVTIIENDNVIDEYYALNDCVITSGYISRIVDVEASVSGGTISYRADGLIVSTPTGSTAYSMSAGGPIIDPATENFCITPICSHSLSAKPIIMGADKEICLKAFSKKRTDIFLTIDGRKICQMKPNTRVIVKKADIYAKLVRINGRSFYKTLSYKFKDSRSV